MSRVIAQRELRNNSAGILRAVENGETFTVTRNGVPVAELRPARKRSTYVTRAELLAALGPAVAIDAAQFRADVDAVVDQTT